MATEQQMIAAIDEMRRRLDGVEAQLAVTQQALGNQQQALATQQSTLATQQAALAAGLPVGGAAGGGAAKLNYNAARSLEPKEWAGRDDQKVRWYDFKEQVVNYTVALHGSAKELLERAARTEIGQTVGMELDEVGLELEGALYRILSKCTTREAHKIVVAAGNGKGLDAWVRLYQHGAPRSASDEQVSVKRILEPKRAANEMELETALQKWLNDLTEHEQRFDKRVEEVNRMHGLKGVIPVSTYSHRMIGQTYANSEALLAHVGPSSATGR